MNTLNWINFGILVIGAFSTTAFVAIYTYRTAWWREEHRAHLALFTLSLAVVLWFYLFRPFFEPTVFAWIRTPMFAAVVACTVWRLTLLLRSKSRHARQ